MNWSLVAQSFICSTLIVMGQAFWKIGLFRNDSENLDTIRSWVSLLTTPWMLLGAVVYIAATVYWILLLKRFPLGLAYPLIIGFALLNSIVVSTVFLREGLTLLQMIGLGLMIVSVFLLAGNPS